MKRAARYAPWLFAAGAAACSVVGVVGASLGNFTWRVAAVVLVAIAAVVFGRQINGLPIAVVAGVALAGVHFIMLDATSTADQVLRLGPLTSIASATVGFALLAVLAVALRARHGRLDRRDQIDLATVTIGAALASWILVAAPLLSDTGVAPAVAIGSTLYLTTSVVLVTFILDLAFAGLGRNRALAFITLAAIANLLGAASISFSTVGWIDIGRNAEIAVFAAAVLLLAAGISHTDAPAILARDEPSNLCAYTPFRLALAAVFLTVPTVLAGAIAPTGGLGVIVRITLMCALVATVVGRLTHAVRHNDRARRTLLDRLHRDELTGLPTRARFVEIVADALETRWRTEFRPTIIHLNLDRFKNINDSLGHDEANRILCAVADRLAVVAAELGGSVARTGGDAFVMIEGAGRAESDTLACVQSIRDALAVPIVFGEQALHVTATIGIATAPRNRTLEAEDLLRRAAIATNEAKAKGRGGLAVFDESMQAHLAERMDVEHALHGAIGRREMRLYHQPIIDVTTGNVHGFEALMRWERDGVIVSPAQFISIAEETGVIHELGAWALTDALCELRGWIDDGVVGPHTTMSVNVSPRQIADPDFADIVGRALCESGLPADLLWLEMTESMMLDQPDLARRTLNSIRDMGVRLALDDFGTGYSSLSLLRQFPIERIKIDRAFVQDIGDGCDQGSLVRTIIAMAHAMNLDVVAEGVETMQQLRALAELRCAKAQGFLISRPVPADAMRSTMAALDELSSLSPFAPRMAAF